MIIFLNLFTNKENTRKYFVLFYYILLLVISVLWERGRELFSLLLVLALKRIRTQHIWVNVMVYIEKIYLLIHFTVVWYLSCLRIETKLVLPSPLLLLISTTRFDLFPRLWSYVLTDVGGIRYYDLLVDTKPS